MLYNIAYYCVYISWITTGTGVVQKQPCNCIATYYLYRTWHGMHGYMHTYVTITEYTMPDSYNFKNVPTVRRPYYYITYTQLYI